LDPFNPLEKFCFVHQSTSCHQILNKKRKNKQTGKKKRKKKVSLGEKKHHSGSLFFQCQIRRHASLAPTISGFILHCKVISNLACSLTGLKDSSDGYRSPEISIAPAVQCVEEPLAGLSLFHGK
jgi:hypothetical protein